MKGFGYAAIGALLLAWQSTGSPAQEKTYRVGVLLPRSERNYVQTATIPELARLGFAEGRNLQVEWRAANGHIERLPKLARELVDLSVDVIVAVDNSAIDAAREATRETPIVMAFMPDDPVASGAVASMARPGGNVTGVALLATEGDVKRLEFLAEAVPSIRRLAVLVPHSITAERLYTIERAALTKGLEIVIARAANRDDYDAAFEAFRMAGASGIVIAAYANFGEHARELAQRAAAAHLPAVCHWRAMADEGCLFSYGRR
jgi:putative ABC transport system substrate-binding protein